jgi:putative transposase
MPRGPRAPVGGICYHVLNRGNRREQVFHDAADNQRFIALMRRSSERIPMRLLAFCLMPNHFHLVLWPTEDGDLSGWMHWLMTSHVASYRVRYETVGRIWQGRYKHFPIQRDQHLLSVMRYAERNPLRARLVEKAEDWPWSSLGNGLRRGPADLVHPSPVSIPDDWSTWLNTPQTSAEIQELRCSVARGRPFGNLDWTRMTAADLALEFSLRPRGRPRRARTKREP